MGFIFAWTFWFQSYIYTEPVSQLPWRAAATGTALALLLLIWVLVDYRAVKSNPDARYPYGPIQELAPPLTNDKPVDTVYVVVNNTETAFTRTLVPGGPGER